MMLVVVVSYGSVEVVCDAHVAVSYGFVEVRRREEMKAVFFMRKKKKMRERGEHMLMK